MSHAPRAFHVVSNKDGSNAHVSTIHEGETPRSLCAPAYVGEKPVRLGRTIAPAPIGCYEDVATTRVNICEDCRKMASQIAATERAFAIRAQLESALRFGQGVTLTHSDLERVLAGFAPWEAAGINVRPDGKPLTGE